MEKKFFLVHDLAEETGLHPDTIRRLADRKVIRSKRNYLRYRVFDSETLAELKAMVFGEAD